MSGCSGGGGGGGGRPSSSSGVVRKEVLPRELELSLGYYAGAVSKGTFEMLPRTLNVLLENFMALSVPPNGEVLRQLASLSLLTDRLLFLRGRGVVETPGDKSPGSPKRLAGEVIVALRKAVERGAQEEEEEVELPPPLPPKTRQPSSPPVDWFANPLFVKNNHHHRESSFSVVLSRDEMDNHHHHQHSGVHHDEEDGGPPPLPPKKRNIMSYMEIFGKSLFAGEVIRHDLNPSEELLYTVWQQNYHDYSSDYAPGSLSSSGLFLSFPAPNQGLPEPPPPLLPPKKKGSSSRLQGGSSSGAARASTVTLNTVTTRSSNSSLVPILLENNNSNSSHHQSRSSSVSLYLCDGGAAEEGIISSSTSSREEEEDEPHHHHPSHSLTSHHHHAQTLQQQHILSPIHQPLSSSSPHHHQQLPHPSSHISHSIHSHSQQQQQQSSSHHRHHHIHRLSLSPVDDAGSYNGGKARDSSVSGSFKTDDGSYDNCSLASGPSVPKEEEEEEEEPSILDLLDASSFGEDLLYYNDNEVRAGTPDALILLATQSIKNDFLYQEAFLGTYRTFLSSGELLYKLMRRFRKLNNKNKEESPRHQRAARSAFSLLVRVVDCLADWDFTDGEVMELLTEFMSELVSEGELMLSKVLRSKFIQKYDAVRCKNLPELDKIPLPKSKNKSPVSILSFKSSELAESMTYLDYQLFLRLESVELILWVQEQNEDKSPNLTKFTEHFNNMSYWARTAILRVGDPRERERVMSKFIKILKFLRKLNNFNSYLAILSALDSAPLRRLEWSRGVTEALSDYCALIDSSSSFRAYRTALNAAGSPCIPYVGLILQDLTFVHIGNVETLEDGRLINFAKRWQQFNILDNLRRFRKEPYNLHRNPEVLSLFDDFRDYLSEDELWKLSEGFKARK